MAWTQSAPPRTTARAGLGSSTSRWRAQRLEWQAERHDQLDVGEAREHERAEREGDGRDDGCGRPPGQIADEEKRRTERQHERRCQREVVGRERIARAPPDRERQNAGAEIRLGVGQGPLVRIEDVGVVEVARISDDRSRHPGDVPDAQLPVAGVHPPDAAQTRHERPGHEHGQRRRQGEHAGGFGETTGPHAAAILARHFISISEQILELIGKTEGCLVLRAWFLVRGLGCPSTSCLVPLRWPGAKHQASVTRAP